MAKVLVAWCDPCTQNDEYNKAESVLVSLDGQAPLELDLCPLHDKELLGSLRDLLAESGQKPGSSPAVTTRGGGSSSGRNSGVKLPCPECHKPLTSEGLRGHLRKVHGVERAAVNETVRTMFGITPRNSGGTFSEPCPECKAEGKMTEEEYTYDTPQGLGAHRRAAHGVEASK